MSEEYCEWKKDNYARYITACERVVPFLNIHTMYKYCPHCGRLVKEIQK